MMIERLTVTQYCMPIVKPLFISKRVGAFVMIQDNTGIVGHGEVAPLTRFSEETLKDASKQLRQLEEWIVDRQIPAGIEKLDGTLTRWLPDLLPSVRCGVEMALLDLVSRQHGVSMRELLSDSPRGRLEVASLLSAEDAEVVERAEDLLDGGVTTAKMKVGHQPVERDLEVLEELNQATKGRMRLRLDANRQWEFEEACAFAKAVKGYPIDYIEEPLRESDRLQEWVECTGLPLALDESIQKDPDYPIEDLKGLSAVVLKPTLIGGFERTMAIARRAEAAGIKSVISAAFETVRGLAGLAHLAAALPGETVAVGLDTGSWFTGPSLPIRNGVLNLAELSPQVKKAAVP